jgi:hypothetical protein
MRVYVCLQDGEENAARGGPRVASHFKSDLIKNLAVPDGQTPAAAAGKSTAVVTDAYSSPTTTTTPNVAFKEVGPNPGGY